jgi:2-methylcitrate dehydratase
MDCRIEVTTKKGARFVEEGSYPKGHAKNPMSEAEVESKFRRLCEGLMPDARREAIVNAVWTLEKKRDVGELLGLIQLDNE